MKTVTARMLTYDADVGRVEPGQQYLVDDAKAERWIFAGVADEGIAKQPEPSPQPQEDDDEENDEESEEDEDEQHDAELQAKAKQLYEAGGSQRSIAEELGVSRAVVRRLLAD